jgi:putative endonuclease
MKKGYYVYIVANESRMLYVGVTSDIERRISEHKQRLVDGYTKRYNLTRLVYCEGTGDVSAAIEREKQLKGWRRARKIALIESTNPRWRDLSEGWQEREPG